MPTWPLPRDEVERVIADVQTIPPPQCNTSPKSRNNCSVSGTAGYETILGGRRGAGDHMMAMQREREEEVARKILPVTKGSSFTSLSQKAAVDPPPMPCKLTQAKTSLHALTLLVFQIKRGKVAVHLLVFKW